VTPGAVLRRSLLAWGLGDMALGRPAAGLAWLAGEIGAIALVAWLTIGLADTTWYALPFLAGVAFLAVWAYQAVSAFKRAQSRQGAIGPTPPRSAAAAVAWLTIPILVWGTGYWLLAGAAANPAAVLDRFESAWPENDAVAFHQLGLGAAQVNALDAGLQRVRQLCAAGSLNPDCGDAPSSLMHDIRFEVDLREETAQAVATVVSFERRSTTFLWVVGGTQLVPVPQQRVLQLSLSEVPAALPGGITLGASRWEIRSIKAP
jgi:hypothetical protein